MKIARIVGTGMAVPECVVDNALLSRCMSTSDEWIVQRTGIRERRMSPDTYRMLLRLAEAPDKTAFMNTAAASVPICLHEALMQGRIKEGDLILLAAFGTGFSWGATLLRW